MAHNGQNGDWSRLSDDAFGEIAMRLDITTTVRLAVCSKELYRQVAKGKGSRCPNDGCGALVAYHDSKVPKLFCPHGPCSCTEAGCKFAASPAYLLTHVKQAHSMSVKSIHYGNEFLHISEHLPAPGSTSAEIVGSGDDGTVFAMLFEATEKYIYYSVVCVRSATCLSPAYKVLYGHGRPSFSFVPTSIASPVGVSLIAGNFKGEKVHRYRESMPVNPQNPGYIYERGIGYTLVTENTHVFHLCIQSIE